MTWIANAVVEYLLSVRLYMDSQYPNIGSLHGSNLVISCMVNLMFARCRASHGSKFMLFYTSLFIFSLCPHATFYKTLTSLSKVFIKSHVRFIQLLKWLCHVYTSFFTHVEPYMSYHRLCKIYILSFFQRTFKDLPNHCACCLFINTIYTPVVGFNRFEIP